MKETLLKIHKHIVNGIKQIPDLLEEIDDLGVSQKASYRDLVTVADKKIEEHLKHSILEICPGHDFLGEESFDKNKNYDAKDLWIIDPIDGTSNFVKQGRDFCTMLSYFKDGEPLLSYVYDIKNDILYSSMKGSGVYKNDEKIIAPKDKSLKESLVSLDLRRMQRAKPELFDFLIQKSFSVRVIGSSGLDGIRVITGKLGAYVHYMSGAWDFSPFFLMASELGIAFTDLNGDSIKHTDHSSFIIACPSAHKEIIDFIERLYREK